MQDPKITTQAQDVFLSLRGISHTTACGPLESHPVARAAVLSAYFECASFFDQPDFKYDPAAAELRWRIDTMLKADLPREDSDHYYRPLIAAKELRDECLAFQKATGASLKVPINTRDELTSVATELEQWFQAKPSTSIDFWITTEVASQDQLIAGKLTDTLLEVANKTGRASLHLTQPEVHRKYAHQFSATLLAQGGVSSGVDSLTLHQFHDVDRYSGTPLIHKLREHFASAPKSWDLKYEEKLHESETLEGRLVLASGASQLIAEACAESLKIAFSWKARERSSTLKTLTTSS